MDPDTPQPPPASPGQLALATAIAAAVALVILVVAVLPAEYGIDPLRAGAALGLVRSAVPADAEPAPSSGGRDPLTPVTSGPSSTYGDAYRVDAAEFELAPYDYLEYKYHLAAAATMIYSWEASAPVIQDFHGAPHTAGAAEVSLDRQTRSRGYGSLTAPFAGMHGWYWENPGGTPIRIRLTSAGFYSTAVESRSNRTRRIHELATPGGAPSTPKGR